MKFLFAPIGIVTGLIAGMLAKKGFEKAWAVIDDEDPPEPDLKQAPTVKLILALALEGAIFRVVKGFADHGVRKGVAKLTGRWPGEDLERAD
jgi:hypothetical protein